jgi:hypothetical protein
MSLVAGRHDERAGSRRVDPDYSAAPCTRICTVSPACPTKPAAPQLAAVAPTMCWNVTCCPVVRLVQAPLLGAMPVNAPPTSVAPVFIGPRTRRATRSPALTAKPAALQFHGDTGSLSVTVCPVVTFSQAAVWGVKPVTQALSACPGTATS